MPQISFIGPSYNLESRPSSVQRTINMVPVPQEPGNERTSWVFKDAPGLVGYGSGVDADPFFADVILLLSGKAAALIDSSKYNRTGMALGGAPDITYDSINPLFGNPTYRISATTGRLTMTPDSFVNPFLGSNEWTDEAWVYISTPGASNNTYFFDVLNGICQPGATGSVYNVGLSINNIGGSSYSVNSDVTRNAWHLVSFVRDNITAGGGNGAVRMFVDGVFVNQTSLFASSAVVGPGSGFNMLWGYFTIGPVGAMIERRITAQCRYRSNFAVPTAPWPLV
jgi:hypothetical protein